MLHYLKNVFQQIQNIPITGVFVYTVSDDTRDCEDSPSYDADQVMHVGKQIYTSTPLKVWTKSFHTEFNRKFGCVLPMFGGLRISDDFGHMLCLNSSIYDNTRLAEVTV